MISFLEGVGVFLLLAGVAVLLFIVFTIVRERARLARSLDIQMFQVSFPRNADFANEMHVAEDFFSTIAMMKGSFIDRILFGPSLVVLEIHKRSYGSIVFLAGVERVYSDYFVRHIFAHFPNARVEIAKQYTLFHDHERIVTSVATLKRDHKLPVATYRDVLNSKGNAVVSALKKIQRGDAAVVQFILQPIQKKGAQRESSMHTQKNQMSGLSSNDKRKRLIHSKKSQQQFLVTIRCAASVKEFHDAGRIGSLFTDAFGRYTIPQLNGFKVSAPTDTKQFLEQLIFRVPSGEGSSVLGAHEIASLYRFSL
jgi:hypothetical protein